MTICKWKLIKILTCQGSSLEHQECTWESLSHRETDSLHLWNCCSYVWTGHMTLGWKISLKLLHVNELQIPTICELYFRVTTVRQSGYKNTKSNNTDYQEVKSWKFSMTRYETRLEMHNLHHNTETSYASELLSKQINKELNYY